MPEENDGVETAADFAQFATESGVMDWLLDSPPGEEVSHEPPVDTGDAVERPRNELGQFVSAQEEEPGEPEAVEETEEVEEEVEAAADDDELVIEIDDELEAVLSKYDGDVGKALKALTESQSMIGRQANEVGELRRQLQQAQAQAQQPQQPQWQQPQFMPNMPYMNDIDENPKALVAEAMQRGDAATMERALLAWGEIEPFEATMFFVSLQQQAAAMQQSAPAHEAPTTAQPTGNIEDAMAEVVARHPDVEQYLPLVEQVAQEFPTLRDSMRSGTPAAQAQAFEEVLKIAKARSSVSDTQKAMKRITLKTQEEVRKEKSDAAVVSAKNRSAATPKEDRLEQFYRAFEEASGQIDDGHWIHRT